MAGSTASEADVKKGDVIAAIDGVPMAGKTSFEGAEQLQARGGVKGSKVTLSLVRESDNNRHILTHTQLIPFPAVVHILLLF